MTRLPLIILALVTSLAAVAPAAAAPVRVDGDGSDLFVDENARLQVRFDGQSFGQFAPGSAEAADAGLNVAVYPPSGPPLLFGFLGQPLTQASPPQVFGDPPNQAASAEWTAGSPPLVEVSASFSPGRDAIVAVYSISNASDQPLHIRPSLVGDLNVGGDDRGTPFLDDFTAEGFEFRFVGGQNGLLRGGFQDVSGDLFDAYEAGPVDEVFGKVRDPLGPGFANEVARGESDNAVGIQSTDHQPGGAVLQPGESTSLAGSMAFQAVTPTADRIEDLPPPQPFREVNVEVARGDVFVRLPPGTDGSSLGARAGQAPGAPKGFVSLQRAAQLPVGTIVDADRGQLKLNAAQRARTGGRLAEATFRSGTFEIVQRRARRPVTELVLKGGTYRGCPRAGTRSSTGEADTSARRRTSRSRVRRLWGSGHGRFRTRGRYSSATVRGTKWLVEDRCDGTLTRLPRRPAGSRVDVRDFGRRKTIRLRAGQSYLARPRSSRRGG